MRYKKLIDCPEGMQRLLVKQGVTVGRVLPIRGAPDSDRSAPPRRSKYGNVRTKFNGEDFDSKAEAAEDQRLRMCETLGEIGGYARQVSIPLRARRGKRMVLDFLVNTPKPYLCEKCGQVNHVLGLVLRDKKGFVTREWETKRRILEAQLGVEIEIV